MSARGVRTAELLANVAVVAAALAVGYSAISRHSAAQHQAERVSASVVGTRIGIPDMTWCKGQKTLLLFLSIDCQFCTGEAPFYGRLSAELQNNNHWRLVVALPQAVSEGIRYVEGLSVRAHQVVHAPRRSILAPGTPTVMVVTDEGLVTQAWVGKLSSQQRTEVIAALRAGAE